MPQTDPVPGTPAPATPILPVTFRVGRIAYAAPVMMMLTAVILAGTSLVYLGWTLAVPVLAAIWMARLRTVVTGNGLHAVTAFASREIDWTELRGLSFPRWTSVRAVCADGSRVRLPALTFRDLPRLSAASGGRIPDPYAAGAGRVEVDATEPGVRESDGGSGSDVDGPGAGGVAE